MLLARRHRLPLVLVAVTAPLGCAVLAGLEDHQPYPTEPGKDSGSDVRADSGKKPREGGKDAREEPIAEDSPADTTAPDVAPAVHYTKLDDSSRWEFFDIATVYPKTAFEGGAVVGDFVYFATNAHSLLRYDRKGTFDDPAAWVLTSDANIPISGEGLVALGHYVYETPLYNGNLVGRYDTHEALDAGTAAFAAYGPPGTGDIDYRGGCTDGKTVYLTPYQYYDGTTSTFVGKVLTYDPAASGFYTASSWTVTDVSAFNAAATGFATCVFDGRYVYFGNNHGGTTARYDTHEPIASASAWTFFQVTFVGASLYGFNGLVYTGRYVVYVPYYTTAYSSVGVAYDTMGKFAELTSWTPYDLESTDGGLPKTEGGVPAVGYSGGQFDGRYVYMSPQRSGKVVRWDSTMAFDDAAAWELYDIDALHPGAELFYGTAFDGEYVYFSTYSGTAMARFKARTTVFAQDPPGSFY